ncbi:MAG: NAD-dependent epimerase/dehydratase family protein [Candidatus Hydrogenedentes bacterium]|nr:NAD-dependent epimerase/dehydratase family protein [Candidatus Hydrogenedentota bacterium]
MGLRRHRADVRVVAFDNLKRRGSELNLSRLRGAGVEFLHGDIRSPEDLEAVGPVDLVLECSAEPSVLAGYSGSPAYVIHTNLTGTVNCLEFARRREAAMIFLSTSRVYPTKTINALACREEATRFALSDKQMSPGASARGISEEFPLIGARSMYGTTKLCSEFLIQEYQEMYDLRAVVNRCSIITGPWQMGKVDQGVVVLWVARHLYGGKLDYIGYGGQGKQVRDMMHIEDVLELILYQMDHLEGLNGETFNVGGGLEVSASLLELTAMCQEVTGNQIPIGGVPEDRPADIRLYLTDYSHVNRVTGWRPKKTAPQILEEIVNWIRANYEELRPILG